MRVFAVIAALSASAAWACRPGNLELPGQVSVSASAPIPVLDASGTDTTAPGAVLISNVTLDLGSGACAKLESLGFTVEGEERARVVVAFGDSLQTASTSGYELLFVPPADGTVSIYLGDDKARSGSGFSRKTLCFALAAVDDAGNVGARSSPWCLDTVTGEGVVTRTGCAVSPWLLAPLVLLLARRRASGRAQR